VGRLATGVLWETVTATTLLESGADIVVLRHGLDRARAEEHHLLADAARRPSRQRLVRPATATAS
jgi:hypothetical protein